MTVLPDEDLRCAAGTRFSFAIHFRFDDKGAPNDGNIAKVLNFGVGKFEPNEFSATGMEFSGAPHYVGLVLPFFLAATDDNCARRHQFLDRCRIACKPCTPYGFARAEQLLVIASLRSQTCRAESCNDENRGGHNGGGFPNHHD